MGYVVASAGPPRSPVAVQNAGRLFVASVMCPMAGVNAATKHKRTFRPGGPHPGTPTQQRSLMFASCAHRARSSPHRAETTGNRLGRCSILGRAFHVGCQGLASVPSADPDGHTAGTVVGASGSRLIPGFLSVCLGSASRSGGRFQRRSLGPARSWRADRSVRRACSRGPSARTARTSTYW